MSDIDELRKQINVELYAFAKYIRHHERTGLGGKNHQGFTSDRLMQLFDTYANQVRVEAKMDESNFIALCCPVDGCNTAIVSPRELSRVNGEITDIEDATSVWDNCPKHSRQGDFSEPYYCDKDGNELSAELTAPQSTDQPNDKESE